MYIRSALIKITRYLVYSLPIIIYLRDTVFVMGGHYHNFKEFFYSFYLSMVIIRLSNYNL